MSYDRKALLELIQSEALQRGELAGGELIDGVSGEVMEWFAEENPEDWDDLDPSRTSLTGE